MINGMFSGRVEREISNRYINVFENGSNELCACAHLLYAIELLNLMKGKTTARANANINININIGKERVELLRMESKKKSFACRRMNLGGSCKKSECMDKIARAACSEANTITKKKESVLINYGPFENTLS